MMQITQMAFTGVIRVICGYSTPNASRTFPPDAALLMA